MSIEKISETWTDIFDKNNYVQTGLATLYRNPQIDPSLDSIIYNPSNHVYSLEPGSNYLFDQKPIAFGFIAYIGQDVIMPLDSSLKSDLKNPKVDVTSTTYYQNYSRVQFRNYSINDKRKPSPRIEKKLEIEFYNELLINENNNLLKSKIFFSEFINVDDRIEKENLRTYVDAFFEWIEDKLVDLNPNENQTKGLGGLREVEAEYLFKEFKGTYIHSKTKQKYFVAIFQNRILPDGWEKVNWIGDKSALFSLMDQLFSIQIEPRFINKYFVCPSPKFHANNRTVTVNSEIKELLKYAKTLKSHK